MRRSKTLPAFSPQELIEAHKLLASRVATMMGRKFEEGDRSDVYRAAKNLPSGKWSNLNIDIMHAGLGLEHKMLCVRSDRSIKEYCGTSLMHPAATRSIRIPSTTGDPTAIARDVLRQYAELVNQRRRVVAENTSGTRPDMRVGWLLWQESLREFLYFEYRMQPPNPENYWAEWKDSGGGARKTSKNLWVYEVKTDRKRYSITTVAGAKIQPYFDVPGPKDPNLYYFCAQGEQLDGDVIRIWVTSTTALLLKQIVGSLDNKTVSSSIVEAAALLSGTTEDETATHYIKAEVAEPILITREAYQSLTTAFPGVSDEHRIQLFVRRIAR
jgi:hypothetical protein